jgi:hypothetical protein
MTDLTIKFTDQLGKALVDVDGEVTLAKVITTALLSPMEDDKTMSGQEKADLFNLWFDKIKDNKEADLTSEDKVLIKERVGKAYAQIIVGQVFKILK